MHFGIATKKIVPPFPTAMHGYGVRKDLFDDVNDPLTCTALILEESGQRAFIGAADLCTFPNDGSTPGLIDRVAEKVGCPRDNVLLCASHTHGGPLTPGSGVTFRASRFADKAFEYAEWLGEQVVAAAGEAAHRMQQGSLWIGEGKTALPMNRRPDRDGQVPNAPNPGGPVDDRMTLFALKDTSGNLASVGMRISCHPVATGAKHLLTADYPGAWRAEFTRAFGPEVTPFFLQGAGADARPALVAEGDHWRALPHADLPILGRDLLGEMLQILARGELREIKDLKLSGKANTVTVPCERRHTTREDFEKLLTSEQEWVQPYAEACIQMLEAGKQIPDCVDYQVQTLWLNDDIALIGLDSEPLCGLGAKIEAAVAPKKAFVLGYVNGCISYVCDTKELKRGGYEADTWLFDLWTGPWEPGLENIFAEGVTWRGHRPQPNF